MILIRWVSGLFSNAKQDEMFKTKNIWITFHINDLSAGVLVKRQWRKNCKEFIKAFCLNQSHFSKLRGMNFNRVYKEVSNDTPIILLSVCCCFAEVLWGEKRTTSMCFIQVNPRLLCSLHRSEIHLVSLYSFSFKNFVSLSTLPLKWSNIEATPRSSVRFTSVTLRTAFKF